MKVQPPSFWLNPKLLHLYLATGQLRWSTMIARATPCLSPTSGQAEVVNAGNGAKAWGVGF